MLRRLCLTLALLPVVLAPALAGAAQQSPQDLVKDTTHEVLAALEAHKQEIKGDPGAVYRFVSDLVLPRFDFQLMSRFVLGRHWNDASAEQRARFVEEFKGLLIRTYGTSLSEYSNEKVKFPPMNADTSRGRVTVPTEIVRSDGPPVPVNYSLYKNDSGEWKVFDVVIEGVSLVQNYRSSFGDEVSRNGLDALIKRLAERNAERGVPG
ncbi:putative phospholipid-binding protein MlaC [wastewater metagenome]|uniref:Putative phospholipid-binding protein MlaC n=2 Tax=unclassified sequences TaxID=12908 RepID=A0A5B8RA84_9ZZZZ|nr:MULTISPECIES: ABC transporter substrate-binding protein [Arhodomonas]MCS4504730.1 ABC transporter substrate-binding protein [Arhodomonas aquaeolei]QEA04953.1 putative phospholipid-binding protein MlaC [uncultured organism]